MNTSQHQIYSDLQQARKAGKKKLAVLIDPDKMRLGKLDQIIDLAVRCKTDYFFIGGSLLVNSQLDHCLQMIREKCSIPLILFPGSSYQLSNKADAILFLSLVSGRNPDLLIGQHVIAAPYLKLSNLEVLPTGYMLIDGGVGTTVLYMSNTSPIPSNKSDIAACTAMAAELLGLKMIFLDAGSDSYLPLLNGVCAVAVAIPPMVVLASCYLGPMFNFHMDEADKANATTAGVMGFFGITEGSIPFAAKKPKLYMPAFMTAGAVAGAIAIFVNIGNAVAM